MKHDVIGELKARFVAWRHGNPANDIKIIAVAGPHGKTTTALLLGEILQESGAAVVVLTNHGRFFKDKLQPSSYDRSVEDLQLELQQAKKDGAFYVIIEVSQALLTTYSLQVLPIELSIITGDSALARGLLEHPASSCVIPVGLDVDSLKVAPHQIISFGESQDAEAQVTRVTERRKGTELELVVDHQTRIELATYLVGKANAMNLAAAVSAAYVMAVSTDSFEEGAARLERVAGNYDLIPADKLSYETIVDRASTRESFEMVLASAKKLKKRRLIIVADATVSSELYPLIAQAADRMIAVSDAPEVPGVEKVADLKTALEVAVRAAKTDDLMVLAGEEFGAVNNENTTKAHRMLGEIKSND